jgi:MFS family permease
MYVVVAGFYLLAAGFCFTLPSSPPPLAGEGQGGTASQAMRATMAQLREGLSYIRSNPTIGWSLVYLGIAAGLIGVHGVIGPAFAEESLGLETEDVWVIVLPLGAGVVLGVLALNSYGRYLPRRRLIEVGLIVVGVLVALLSVAGPISRFLQGVSARQPVVDLSGVVSLLAVVVVLAFFAGIAYAFVAIPAQTQLQEELPEDVRGRVFGVLNMLVSIASFLPIIIVGPIADLIGTTPVIVAVGLIILVLGIGSILARGPIRPEEASQSADTSGTAGRGRCGGGRGRHGAPSRSPAACAGFRDAEGAPAPLEASGSMAAPAPTMPIPSGGGSSSRGCSSSGDIEPGAVEGDTPGPERRWPGSPCSSPVARSR